MKGSILVNEEWVIERGKAQQTLFCLLFNGFVSPLPPCVERSGNLIMRFESRLIRAGKRVHKAVPVDPPLA